VPQAFVQRRPGDPPILVADSRAAREILRWTPRFSLREIVESAWLWQSCKIKVANTPFPQSASIE